MLKQATKRRFGLFSGIKNALKIPFKHANKLFEGSYGDHSPIGNISEKFDDEASEWKSYVVENSYELNTFQTFEQNIQGNFGTIDNPHLIFVSDLPYRFVGCTGPPNEDDYEGHEIMYFMLREGPLQRCGSCGQVFKLIRLRDEFSAENDYYQRDFVRQHVQEFGEADHWIQQNLIRFMMLSSYEHSHFETATNTVFNLRNSDDHDRILVDPAYRLEQAQLAEKKSGVMYDTLQKIEDRIKEQHGSTQVVSSKDTYENIINAELALAELDSHFKNVQRFHIRKFLDASNHERREARMLGNAQQRTQQSESIYLKGTSETELQFRDYYESDQEALSSLQFDKANVKQQILSNPDYKITNYNFQEEYTLTADPDASNYVRKKVFKFNYRQAFVTPEDHQRKEKRMIERLASSGFMEKLQELTQNNAKQWADQQTTNINSIPFYEMVVEQAVLNYQNYYESDLEDDFEYLVSLPAADKKEFIETFSANGFIQEQQEFQTVIQEQLNVDPEQGVMYNGINFWNRMNDYIIPKYNNLTGMNLNQDMLDKAIEKANEEKQKNQNILNDEPSDSNKQ